MTESGPKTKN